jgi:hypothetical protein
MNVQTKQWQDKERNGGLISPLCLSLSTERIISVDGVKTWEAVKTCKGSIESTERFYGVVLFAAQDLHTNLYRPSMTTKPEGQN